MTKRNNDGVVESTPKRTKTTPSKVDKRPDRHLAMQRRKLLNERVVKVSLPGILVNNHSKVEVRRHIDNLVCYTSKVTNLGSIVLNRMLLHCLNNDVDLPDLNSQTLFRQCMLIGVEDSKCNWLPVIQEVWAESFGSFQKIPHLKYSSTAVEYAAISLKTTLKNSLCVPFHKRQGYVIKAFLAERGFDTCIKNIKMVKCLINGWKCEAKFSEVEQPLVDEFVSVQRGYLGLGDEEAVHDEWLKKYPSIVLKYYYKILKYIEGYNARVAEEDWVRLFTIAPISAIKRHFIKIDSNVLYGIMKNSQIAECTRKNFHFMENVFKVFEFNNVKVSSKYRLKDEGVIIETDGISAGVHYFSYKRSTTATDPSNPLQLLAAVVIILMLLVINDDADLAIGVADFASGVGSGVAADFATATASCSAADDTDVNGGGAIFIAMFFHFLSFHFLSLRHMFSMFSKKKRVIGIDPGRANIIYASEKLPSGKLKKYKLTRKEYYEKCGFNHAKRATRKWLDSIKDKWDYFSQNSPKTANPQQFDTYIRQYSIVYEDLWENKCKKKWGQLKFRNYRNKRKVIDNFLQSMHQKGEMKPVIAYGAAKFASGGKGELSVPVKYIKERCSHYYKTVLVDEYRTSCVCPWCDQLLEKVVKKVGENEFREVRGLRRCCSTVCSRFPFKNRDLVGALNILRCFVDDKRPATLTRNPKRAKVNLKKYYLPT